MRYMLGIDVGGTFTDLVAYDREAGRLEVWKVPSVPGDPVAGILAGLVAFAGRDSVANIRLGTTVATNALLEKKGAVVAYVTTKGFRDVPFIQRGNRKYHYDMSWVKPKPLARRRHCFELTERVDAHGRVHIPLDEAEVRELAARIRAMPEIGAVAVCLLFSYLNPTHERLVERILREELPGMPLSISYDVLPKWKEYERASTTIADAYLKPVVSRQLGEMRRRLAAAGLDVPTVVIKSNGGEMTLEVAAAAPVNLVVSGPTGGVIASRHVAALAGIEHLVTIDMGGTSTDVSTVIGGKESFTTAFEIEWGVPIQIPIVDIRTIGAGGGSIAWIDKGGMLRVGPQSAGAEPGPAAYGKGGAAATVTDANVVLGRIDPERFLGGAMPLDAEAARAAVARVAAALGQEVETAAMAILRIANVSMMGALRSVLIERGLDPRDFTLCAFGGAGPLHAADLIAEMGILRAIVPSHPGQFSAWGFIVTDARVDRQRTTQLTSKSFDPAKAQAIMAALVAEALAELEGQGYREGIGVRRALEMRYLGQNYELELEVGTDGLAGGERLWNTFHAAHKARFGFATPGEIIEIVNYTVTATARSAKPELPRLPHAAAPAAPSARRRVVFSDGPHDTPIHQRPQLRAGHVVDGPALVEEAASVTVVNPGQRLTVDGWGHLMLHATR
jgi:N-methylhydantoinase A